MKRVISKVHGVFLPQPFGLGAVNLLRHGDQIFPTASRNRPPPLPVAAPLHPAVTKTGVAAKAQGFAILSLTWTSRSNRLSSSSRYGTTGLRLPGRQAAASLHPL